MGCHARTEMQKPRRPHIANRRGLHRIILLGGAVADPGSGPVDPSFSREGPG